MNIQEFDNVEIIKLLTHKKGSTQKALAEKVGLSPAVLSDKIRKGNLRVVELQKICDILGYELVLKEKS